MKASQDRTSTCSQTLGRQADGRPALVNAHRTRPPEPDSLEALITAEARLRLAIEAANIGFWDWNIKSNSVYHSPEWKRQLGYNDDEVADVLDEWQSRLHPDDKPRVLALAQEFARLPRSGYDTEFRLQHRDGSYRWIHSQGMLLRDRSGRPERMLGVHVDITASKLRELELRESEERFRRLVETTAILPWEADPQTGRFTYVGPRAAMLLGFSLKEWYSDDFWRLHLHPLDQEAAVEFRREQASLSDDYDGEYRMIANDGRVVWFHDYVHVTRGARGVEKLQGFLVDVTERRQAAEEHARLAAIVESSHDAIIGVNLDGKITSWNRSATRIYGYSAAEALGRSVRMLAPRERVEESTQILAQVRRGELIDDLQTLRLRKDGHLVHVSLVVSPIFDAAGQIIGASAIARDITERKLLEAEVLRISEREQQRIAQDLHDGLGQLLSGTFHLATVLQQNLADQALPEAAEGLRITELLNLAVTEARSLARGLYPVPPENNGLTVALQDLAQRTTERFRVPCSFICRNTVRFEDNAAATHLYRIAQEAVTNALKHGQSKKIIIRLSESRSHLTLRIRDNGRGLPKRAATAKGLGIRIMHYRASMIGGALRIQNTKRGVTVMCTVRRVLSETWTRKKS